MNDIVSSIALTDIALTLGATIGFITLAMLILWLISLKVKDVSIIDMFWGAGFGLIALLCLALNEIRTDYLYLLTALPVLWSIRYTYYIIWRNWGHGEDPRYTNIRSNVTEKQWPLYALRKVFVFQGLAMLIVAAPLWVGLGTGLGKLESFPHPFSGEEIKGASVYAKIGIFSLLGTILWIIGFLFRNHRRLATRAVQKKSGRSSVQT